MNHPAEALAVGLAVVATSLSLGCSDESGGTTWGAPTTTTSTTTTTTTTTTTIGSGGSGAEGGAGANGGSAGEGGTGGGGGASCRAVTVGAFALDDSEPGGSSLAYEMDGLDAGHDHYVFIEFFDVAGPQQTGSYTLGLTPDDNYSSCAHCVIAFENFDQTPAIAYFAESGTMEVTTADAAYTGVSAGSLQNVRLIEVTVDGSTTTPVEGGRCLTLDGSWDHTQ